MTNDKIRQTSLRCPAKQHLRGGRGEGGGWTQKSWIFKLSVPKLRNPETVWPEFLCLILRGFSAESDTGDTPRPPGPALNINVHETSASQTMSGTHKI